MAHSLALERSPNNSTISNCKLRHSTSRQYAALGKSEGIHDSDNIVCACACTLHVPQQLRRDQLLHITAKVRWMQCYLPLEIIEEEHLAGANGPEMSRCVRSRLEM